MGWAEGIVAKKEMPIFSVRVKVTPGVAPIHAADELVAMAQRTSTSVLAEFQGREIRIDPDTTMKAAEELFVAALPEAKDDPTEWLIYTTKEEGYGGVYLWWRPAAAGYTRHVEQAGRYTEEEARARCQDGGNGALPLAVAVSQRLSVMKIHDGVPLTALQGMQYGPFRKGDSEAAEQPAVERLASSDRADERHAIVRFLRTAHMSEADLDSAGVRAVDYCGGLRSDYSRAINHLALEIEREAHAGKRTRG